MGYPTSLFVFLAFFSCCFISSSLAYNTFYVGGKDGWVLHPSEPYNHWAERLRFQINDKLVFKYNNESDSVLQVKKYAYHSCKTKNPIKSMTSGTSVFQFDNSGLFYFITGNKQNCRKGQKLIIWVLSPRPSVAPKPPSATPAPSPKPLTPPVAPKSSPPSQVPPPGQEGGSNTTVTAPAPAPSDSMIVSPSSLMVYGVALLASIVFLLASQ